MEQIKLVTDAISASTVDNVAIYGLIATIFLAVVSWIINLRLQQKDIRDQHKAKISYEIYRELVILHKDLQGALSKFGASTNAPLILMSTELISLEVQEKFGNKSLLPPTTETECLHKGTQKYTNWIYNDLYAKYGLYEDAYIRFLYLIEDWTAPLAATEQAQTVLRQELHKLNEQISPHLDALQNYSREHGDDWRKWNKDDVYRHGEAIVELTMTASCYIGDFMVIAHNELLAPYYGHKRATRKTIDADLQVLTSEGLATSVEDDPEVRAKAEEIIRNNTQ